MTWIRLTERGDGTVGRRYRDLMICVVFTGSEGLRIIGEIQVRAVPRRHRDKRAERSQRAPPQRGLRLIRRLSRAVARWRMPGQLRCTGAQSSRFQDRDTGRGTRMPGQPRAGCIGGQSCGPPEVSGPRYHPTRTPGAPEIAMPSRHRRGPRPQERAEARKDRAEAQGPPVSLSSSPRAALSVDPAGGARQIQDRALHELKLKVAPFSLARLHSTQLLVNGDREPRRSPFQRFVSARREESARFGGRLSRRLIADRSRRFIGVGAGPGRRSEQGQASPAAIASSKCWLGWSCLLPRCLGPLWPLAGSKKPALASMSAALTREAQSVGPCVGCRSDAVNLDGCRGGGGGGGCRAADAQALQDQPRARRRPHLTGPGPGRRGPPAADAWPGIRSRSSPLADAQQCMRFVGNQGRMRRGRHQRIGSLFVCWGERFDSAARPYSGKRRDGPGSRGRAPHSRRDGPGPGS